MNAVAQEKLSIFLRDVKSARERRSLDNQRLSRSKSIKDLLMESSSPCMGKVIAFPMWNPEML